MKCSKKVSERNLKDNIKYYFDVSSDKELLLVDILDLIDTNIIKKIIEEIKFLKKDVVSTFWWCKSYEEAEDHYNKDFLATEDNRGTIDKVSKSIGCIRAYEKILKLLGEIK